MTFQYTMNFGNRQINPVFLGIMIARSTPHEGFCIQASYRSVSEVGGKCIHRYHFLRRDGDKPIPAFTVEPVATFEAPPARNVYAVFPMHNVYVDEAFQDILTEERLEELKITIETMSSEEMESIAGEYRRRKQDNPN